VRQQGDETVDSATAAGGVYLARILIADTEAELLRPGMLGRASITAERQTIAAYIQRWLASLWKFH
jgi:hypothetical protein